jgi:hypothetical protein
LNQWFPQSKGLANSAILVGFGMGGIISNQIQTKFTNPLNYSPDKAFNNLENNSDEK